MLEAAGDDRATPADAFGRLLTPALIASTVLLGKEDLWREVGASGRQLPIPLPGQRPRELLASRPRRRTQVATLPSQRGSPPSRTWAVVVPTSWSADHSDATDWLAVSPAHSAMKDAEAGHAPKLTSAHRADNRVEHLWYRCARVEPKCAKLMLLWKCGGATHGRAPVARHRRDRESAVPSMTKRDIGRSDSGEHLQ